MTHDLLRNLIVELGLKVERVVVTSLRENTFYAVIELTGESGEVDAPGFAPSDAIALALRADCPIYVDSEVIQASRNRSIPKARPNRRKRRGRVARRDRR